MRNSIYHNSEGYFDPTAGAAITNCVRKERSDRRKAARKAYAKARAQDRAEKRAIVYICSRYAGDIANNVAAAQKYCKYAVDRGCVPFAPHLLFPQFLNDADPAERELGLAFGNIFMGKCRELWIFGSELSAGMQAEYNHALEKGFKIRFFTNDCREVEGYAGGAGNERI